MGLPRPVYQAILADMDLPVLACPHLGLLQLKYPGVHPDTLCATFAQENQYKVLKSHHIHKANMDAYCARYLAGEDLLVLCGEVDFPPCLMVRRMLEGMMGLSKQRVSEVVKQPTLLQGVDAAAALQLWQQRAAPQQQHQQQEHTQQHSHNTHHHCHHHHQQQQQQPPADFAGTSSSSCGGSGGDSSRCEPQQLLQRLQRDVVRCTYADRSYSPYCDMAKSLAGLEHEALLYQQLSAAGVPFWSEQELRERGLFKTPDALLQVPICIKGGDGQWHMVHWIDSKASFGDDRTHAQQMEGQYATYVNRYGPGCVIYWFGFISDLAVTVQQAGQQQQHQQHQQKAGGQWGLGEQGKQQEEQGLRQVDVLLRDSFPAVSEIMQLHQHGDAGTEAAAAADVGVGRGGSLLPCLAVSS